MIRSLISIIFIFIALPAFAEFNYVSPESYAVNESDLNDYRKIPPAPKLNLDTLESMRFKEEKNNNFELTQNKTNKKAEKPAKQKKEKKEKAFEDRLSYKFAKWWVDQRYKREEEHHGQKHEIKVNKRLEYEKRLEENLKNETN